MKLLERWFGVSEGKVLNRYKARVDAINALESYTTALSDEALKGETEKLKARIANGATLDDVLVDAFAVVREAAKRTLKQRHYDVQLIGGMVLHDGSIAEMRTGEGKTLVATLPAYLNALAGKGVHVVTVNDYLARRDAVWMGQVFDALGLKTAVLNHQSSFMYDPKHKEEDELRDQVASFKVVYDFLRPCTRQEAYRADITYGTNSEFGFDYLRDNLEYDASSIRQHSHAYAIVDEIDSILIDESRTPLIISAPAAESEDLYGRFARIAESLHEGDDYVIDEKHREINLTDAGIAKAEKALGIENIYTDAGVKYAYHLETAVKAKALFHKDKEYVVRDDEVIIVDEYTGRLQPGRRWSGGVHQAVEAKESVRVQRETRTFASITYQNYFRMYKKLGGMTGTAFTSREEFYKVYGLDVLPIPTHRTVVRIDKQDQIYQSEHGKFLAIAKDVKELHKIGQPVLIGTVSIEKNEQLSAYLTAEGVPHTLLNAKNHEKEGEIVANAGLKGAVTVATNMAGRGVDIKLGGATADKEAYDEVKALGGLHVIGTERHTARRIDNQLRGRAGRQGDPGVTQFYVSLDDELMRIFAKDTVKRLLGTFKVPEDVPIESRMLSRMLESAQSKIEGLHFDGRKHTLQYDDVLNYQRNVIYARRRAILEATDANMAEAIEEFFRSMGDEAAVTSAREALEAKIQEIGATETHAAVRRLLLQAIDSFWVDHLDDMDYLRNTVSLRSYGQRDPLVEYKREGLRLFKILQRAVYEHVLSLIPKITPQAFVAEAEEMRRIEAQAIALSGGDQSNGNQPMSGPARIIMQGAAIAAHDDKVGRNDKITIQKGSEQKQIKFKQLEQYEKEGWRKI